MTNIGQKTGILKHSKNVQTNPITVLFVTEYQNLNSGNRRINGRNSSLALVGNSGPLSSAIQEKNIQYYTNTRFYTQHTIKVHSRI